MKPSLKKVYSQPSWVIRNRSVELAITQLGGHLAPVTFYRDTKTPIQPYHIAPWHAEKAFIQEPVLRPLRGDFFCMPFAGGQWQGKSWGVHGEPATKPWKFHSLEQQDENVELVLRMDVKEPRGRITKTLTLLKGHNVVYTQHLLEGFRGKYPLAHHATLRMPETQRRVRLSTSPFALGLTFSKRAGNPEIGEYDSLLPAQSFKSLEKVPTMFKDPASDNLTLLPRAKGYVDLAGVFHKPASTPTPAWTAAVFLDEGFAWYSLKDPAVLPCLSLWMENHGRWSAPWNGRNNCLGLEDGACYLPAGIGPSLRPNPASKAGIPTYLELLPTKPTAINYIQGVVKVPAGFNRVVDVEFDTKGATFIGEGGKKALVRLSPQFVFTGEV